MEAQGKYSVKDTGEVVNYNFDYIVLEGDTAEAKIENAISELGASKVASDIQRTLKVDANNLAREKAKTANGHSTRPVMTEEEKAEAKAKRANNKAILDKLAEKGLTLADIENLS